jgi:2-polyprenyl-6-methoxyphenol hydroxylase-like FAD-dependent oxidoreductase
MYPIGANGASQTIVDAAALAAALTDAPDPGTGLRAYEDERRPKTAEVVLANRRSGPEAVLDIADARLTGPGDRVEDLVTPAEREAIAARYRQVAGFVKRGETA